MQRVRPAWQGHPWADRQPCTQLEQEGFPSLNERAPAGGGTASLHTWVQLFCACLLLAILGHGLAAD